MVFFLGALAHAASVNVSPTDDLQALTSSLGPGDVILFGPGTYVLENTVVWTGIGTAEAPIEFRTETNAEVILQTSGGGYVASLENSQHVLFRGLIFEGGENVEYYGPSGLRLLESSDVIVEDCVIRNVSGNGLRVDGNATNITIRHNEVSGSLTGNAIEVGCWDGSCWMQDSLIEFNLLHDVGGDGIYLSNGTQATQILHNVIFNIADNGMYLGPTNFGDQNIVRANAIWQVENDGMYIEGSALVQNNVIFETGDEGIYVRNNYDGLYDLQISHNTIANTDGYAAYLEDWYSIEGLVFANNALANPTGYGLYWEDLAYDYYGYSTGEETENFIANNVVTGLIEGFELLERPTFVIPGGGVADYVDIEFFDFYPSPTSLLRDAGTPDGNAYIPADDFNGVARDGASPDAGAYEYDGETNPGWTIAETYKTTDLTRTGDEVLSTGCCGGGNNSNGSEALVFLPFLALGAYSRRRRG